MEVNEIKRRNREAVRKYRSSEKYRKTQQRYIDSGRLAALQNSDSYKKVRREYEASESTKIKRRAYQKSDKYKTYLKTDARREIDRISRKKYKQSPHGKLRGKVDHYKRKARLFGGGGSFTSEEFLNLIKLANYSCPCCLEKIPTDKFSVDHIIPISKGGNSYINNIQPLCRNCNSSKGIKSTNYLVRVAEVNSVKQKDASVI